MHCQLIPVANLRRRHSRAMLWCPIHIQIYRLSSTTHVQNLCQCSMKCQKLGIRNQECTVLSVWNLYRPLWEFILGTVLEGYNVFVAYTWKWMWAYGPETICVRHLCTRLCKGLDVSMSISYWNWDPTYLWDQCPIKILKSVVVIVLEHESICGGINQLQHVF